MQNIFYRKVAQILFYFLIYFGWLNETERCFWISLLFLEEHIGSTGLLQGSIMASGVLTLDSVNTLQICNCYLLSAANKLPRTSVIKVCSSALHCLKKFIQPHIRDISLYGLLWVGVIIISCPQLGKQLNPAR